jgi:hypothetical protein
MMAFRASSGIMNDRRCSESSQLIKIKMAQHRSDKCIEVNSMAILPGIGSPASEVLLSSKSLDGFAFNLTLHRYRDERIGAGVALPLLV